MISNSFGSMIRLSILLLLLQSTILHIFIDATKRASLIVIDGGKQSKSLTVCSKYCAQHNIDIHHILSEPAWKRLLRKGKRALYGSRGPGRADAENWLKCYLLSNEVDQISCLSESLEGLYTAEAIEKSADVVNSLIDVVNPISYVTSKFQLNDRLRNANLSSITQFQTSYWEEAKSYLMHYWSSSNSNTTPKRILIRPDRSSLLQEGITSSQPLWFVCDNLQQAQIAFHEILGKPIYHSEGNEYGEIYIEGVYDSVLIQELLPDHAPNDPSNRVREYLVDAITLGKDDHHVMSIWEKTYQLHRQDMKKSPRIQSLRLLNPNLDNEAALMMNEEEKSPVEHIQEEEVKEEEQEEQVNPTTCSEKLEDPVNQEDKQAEAVSSCPIEDSQSPQPSTAVTVTAPNDFQMTKLLASKCKEILTALQITSIGSYQVHVRYHPWSNTVFVLSLQPSRRDQAIEEYYLLVNKDYQQQQQQQHTAGKTFGMTLIHPLVFLLQAMFPTEQPRLLDHLITSSATTSSDAVAGKNMSLFPITSITDRDKQATKILYLTAPQRGRYKRISPAFFVLLQRLSSHAHIVLSQPPTLFFSTQQSTTTESTTAQFTTHSTHGNTQQHIFYPAHSSSVSTTSYSASSSSATTTATADEEEKDSTTGQVRVSNSLEYGTLLQEEECIGYIVLQHATETLLQRDETIIQSFLSSHHNPDTPVGWVEVLTEEEWMKYQQDSATTSYTVGIHSKEYRMNDHRVNTSPVIRQYPKLTTPNNLRALLQPTPQAQALTQSIERALRREQTIITPYARLVGNTLYSTPHSVLMHMLSRAVVQSTILILLMGYVMSMLPVFLLPFVKEQILSYRIP